MYADDADFPIDSNVITKLVQNLSGLKSLKLASANLEEYECRRHHVVSQTLESLDVSQTGKNCVLSCECPRLKKYWCDGFLYANGTRPLLSREQYDGLGQYVVDGPPIPGREHVQGNKSLVVTADTFEFPHFRVPDSCAMNLLTFFSWDDGYEVYNENALKFKNAIFRAF
jgi:hypothetical protein